MTEQNMVFSGVVRDNLISADPLVSAIFEAIKGCDGEPIDKLKAVIRAGKIAKAFLGGGPDFDVIEKVFGKGERKPREIKFRVTEGIVAE